MIYNPKDWYWIIGSDAAHAYASARALIVPASDSDFVAWQSAGGIPTSIDTMDSLIDVLRAAGVPPYHKVRTYTVVKRLEAAGKIEAADTALAANKTLYRQFYTSGTIDGDYQPARDFLAALGADVDAILAPE